MSNPQRRPLVNGQPVDEFGAVSEAESFHDPVGQGQDLLYVPGWSQLRQERDKQLAEYNAGTRLGQDVLALPVNVRWTRRADIKEGRPDPQKLASVANQGYRAVTKEMVGKEKWLTELPPGASVQADGTIRNAAGDLQLMYAPASVAARNARRKADASRAQVEAAGTQVDGGLIQVGASHKGSSPTVTKT